MPKRIDLTDQTFGELRVVKLSDRRDKRNRLLWECRCSCDKVVYLHGYSLLHGHYRSCGCMRVKKRDRGAAEHVKRDRVNGTRKTALTAKPHKDSKSGIKGVTWLESRQKWQAYIGFKGKSINLGYFVSKDDAKTAREAAEDKYHKPILEADSDE